MLGCHDHLHCSSLSMNCTNIPQGPLKIRKDRASCSGAFARAAWAWSDWGACVAASQEVHHWQLVKTRTPRLCTHIFPSCNLTLVFKTSRSPTAISPGWLKDPKAENQNWLLATLPIFKQIDIACSKTQYPQITNEPPQTASCSVFRRSWPTGHERFPNLWAAQFFWGWAYWSQHLKTFL